MKFNIQITLFLILLLGIFQFANSQNLPVSDSNAMTPYLTRDNNNEIVLSWVEKDISSGDFKFVYSRFNRTSGKFENNVIIKGTKGLKAHGENLPKIAFKNDGTIIAMYGSSNPSPKNKYAGLIYYTISTDKGENWSVPKQLSDGVDERYFDLAPLADGEVAVVWLDSRKETEEEGSSVYLAKTSGKDGFGPPAKIGESSCQCCRTDLYTDSKNRLHVIYRDIIEGEIRDIVHSVSEDNGKTFSKPVRISEDNWKIMGCPHTGPAMVENSNTLHFAWYSLGQGEGIFYTKSKDGGKTFDEKISISNSPQALHPQIATIRNDQIVVVWDEVIKQNESNLTEVGVAIIGKDNSITQKEYISAEKGNSSFPVLTALNNTSVLVVWAHQEGDKSGVFYKIWEAKK